MHQPFPDDTFLARWLNGELSETELQQLQQRDDFALLRQIVESTDKMRSPAFSEATAWERLQQARMQQKASRISRLSQRWWYGLAAAFALLAISFWFVVKTPETVYQTAKTEQLLIQLPDASEVLLDENSKLVLDADWSEERQLKLEGEAFFKVEKGKPFIVVLPVGEVQVLGTSFRVETTVDELEVACYSGKIKVNYRKSSEVLNPGDQARAEKADKLEVKRGQQSQRADNQETILRFQSRPLAEVFKAMELHFKVKIQFPVSDTRTYTGFFKTADLKEALKTVCVPMSLDYTIKDKTVTITKK